MWCELEPIPVVLLSYLSPHRSELVILIVFIRVYCGLHSNLTVISNYIVFSNTSLQNMMLIDCQVVFQVNIAGKYQL